MTLRVIAYSPGTGGRWLTHMLWALENNCTTMPPVSGVNYHQGRWSRYFEIYHNDTNEPSEFTFGGHCKFNLFLNSWIKFRRADNYNSFNSMNQAQQILVLSNDVTWRLGAAYAGVYDTHIDLDYADIFKNTPAFRQQLISMLSRAEWPYCDRVTQPFVDDAAAQFRATVVDPREHWGNVHSTGWLAWCHSWCQQHSVEIPVSVADAVPEYQQWLLQNQQPIIDDTKQYLL